MKIALFAYTLAQHYALNVGTDGPGSCTAVLVVTQVGAVVGHVSPLLDGGITHADFSDFSIDGFMDQFTSFIDIYQSHFSRNSIALVVCALFQGRSWNYLAFSVVFNAVIFDGADPLPAAPSIPPHTRDVMLTRSCLVNPIYLFAPSLRLGAILRA